MNQYAAIRYLAAVAFAYETAAIVTGLPTISQLCNKHKWLAAVAVGGLTVHLLTFPQPVTDVL